MRTIFRSLLILGISVTSSFAAPHGDKPVPVRVALVNVKSVLDRYEKASQFKKDLQKAKAPFDRRAKRHKDDITAWQNAIDERDFTGDTEEQLKAKVIAANKHLETITADVRSELGKMEESMKVALWKDIQAAIKTCATENKIDLVLGYDDPDKKSVNLFPNVSRKMNAMDLGGTVALQMSPRVDMTQAVIDLLNERPREKAGVVGADRVAVVNIGQVFNQYRKATKFKNELEADLAPYKQKANQITEDIRDWEDALRSGDLTGEAADQLRAKIKQSRKQLDDLGAEVPRVLGKRQEENLVVLWKEVQAGIKTYATDRDIDLVLGYGDVMEKDLLDRFPNVNRKMQALDEGHLVPLRLAARTDISSGIVHLLNAERLEKKDKKLEPVRVAVVNIGYVFNKYDRALAVKKEFEERLAPFKKKAKTLTDEIKKWEATLSAGKLKGDEAERYINAIKQNRRELGDLCVEIQQDFGAKQESNLVTLWKDVQMGNAAVAESQNIELLLGSGDFVEREVLDRFPNVNRKMKALEAGGIVPLFIAPRLDISEAVTTDLNRGAPKKEQAQPDD